MLRVFWSSLCLAVLVVSGFVATGCNDDEPDTSAFAVGPDNEYPIPGLGLNNEVFISVRHVGVEPNRVDSEEPSIGGLRVIDDESTLAEDPLMFQGDTLRFNYDDTTFELTVLEFNDESYDRGDPDARATLVVEIL